MVAPSGGWLSTQFVHAKISLYFYSFVSSVFGILYLTVVSCEKKNYPQLYTYILLFLDY